MSDATQLNLAGESLHTLTFAAQVIDPVIELEIAGLPITQGSKRILPAGGVSGGFPILVEDRSAKLKQWRAEIGRAVEKAQTEAWGRGLTMPFDGPVMVAMTFRLPRPKSLHRRVRFPISRHDLDKLARAVGDSLAGNRGKRAKTKRVTKPHARLISDDGRIVRTWLSKDFGAPGVTIRVARLWEGA